MYITDFHVLNEAEITHGGSIGNSFSRLPKDLQDKIKAKLKSRGKSEDDIKLITSNISLMTILNSGGTEKQYSIDGMDIIDGMIRHELEVYDKARDERILVSKDIVKAYHEACELQFDKAKALFAEVEEKLKKGEIAPGTPYDTEGKEVGNLVRVIGGMENALDDLKDEYDLSDSDCKRAILENAFCMTDDPNQIKDIINARIQYNNTMIAILKKMVQENYATLGYSDMMAKMYIESLDSDDQEARQKAIKDIKNDITLLSDDKFKKDNYYDFRSIGGGCLFYTDYDLGVIENDTTAKRLIQYAFQYDAVVIGHGGNSLKDMTAKEAEAAIDELVDATTENEMKATSKLTELAEKEQALTKVLTPLNDTNKAFEAAEQYKNEKKLKFTMQNLTDIKKRIGELTDIAKKAAKNNDSKTVAEIKDELERIEPVVDRYIKKLDDLTEKVNKATKDDSTEAQVTRIYKECIYVQLDQMKEQNRILDKWNKFLKDHKDMTYWEVQPIKTLNGGPYTDMNDLVRQLIKEGFKNIYIISCNPGNHELAKDILDTKGVKIRHSVNSTFSEAVDDSSFDRTFSILDETTNELDILSETYCFDDVLYDINNISLTEGAISKAWNTLVGWIKKIIGVVVNFFKKVIAAFKSAIEKIKVFFEKRMNKGKFIKKVKVGIVKENEVKEVQIDSYEQLKKEVIESCEKLAEIIKKYEQESIKGMQEAEKYADQQSKKAVNESIGSMDILVNMLW